MNLIELALTTYTESKAQEAETTGEYAEEARREFLQDARNCAARTLAQDAADLDWQYTPASELPDQVEEARALLAPGGPAYLRYRADHGAEKYSFDLVQPRHADRISPVTGLFHLGQLLSEGDARRPTAAGNSEQPPAAPGPLAGIEALEGRAIRTGQLARRLLAQHAELTLNYAHVIGYSDGDCSGELQLRAASIEAAQLVAAALGIELTTQISSTHPGYVFRKAEGAATVDGIEVKLTAHIRLPDDEADAWRTEQAKNAADGSQDRDADGDA